MAKNPKSTALVPAGQRKPPAKRKAAVPAVMPATPDALRPVLGLDLAIAKLVGSGGDVAREDGIVRVTGLGYATRGCVVPAEEIFYDRSARRDDEGARLGEADKVSWRDEASGYDCIMLRDSNRRHLSGYVGAPRDHPIWGWKCEAVPPDLGIDVHGGLMYSRLCQHGPSPTPGLVVEAARICHVRVVPPPRFEPLVHATDHRVEHADAWWFGFSCDQVYDVVPADVHGQAKFLQAEVGAVYRDDAYVVHETVSLAAQLRAIADGKAAPSRDGPPPPPIGLDPRRGGGRG
ncbi:hypothetical protein SPAN111604_05310 [Sphingomonas antarctica]|uniref:hypothetical protein n=1 Tax=Sphingomonas antarctica TaxID=2040274 RepID=UPI0039EA73F8